MIFYFSATGNSLYTAQKLALSLQEPICNIIDFINQNKFNYILKIYKNLIRSTYK